MVDDKDEFKIVRPKFNKRELGNKQHRSVFDKSNNQSGKEAQGKGVSMKDTTYTSRGRPKALNTELKDYIVRQMTEHNRDIMDISRDDIMPSRSTIYDEMNRDPVFSIRIARAREALADHAFNQIKHLGDNVTPENANAMRVKFQALAWQASKMSPRRYGDKLETNATVDVTQRHVIDVSSLDGDKRDALRSILMAAEGQARTINHEPQDIMSHDLGQDGSKMPENTGLYSAKPKLATLGTVAMPTGNVVTVESKARAAMPSGREALPKDDRGIPAPVMSSPAITEDRPRAFVMPDDDDIAEPDTAMPATEGRDMPLP